jgi:hypothetical protein
VSGKKPRIGRPPIPKKLQKASLLSVRFSAEERRIIERAAGNEGLSAWARRTLLASASSSTVALPEPAPESPSVPH